MTGKTVKVKNINDQSPDSDNFVIFDTLLEGCQIIDHDWKYIYVNDAVVNHSHKRREELLGKTMMEAYPGIDETELFKEMRKVMEDRTISSFENKFIYPDGEVGWFELHIQPISQGILILSIDITDNKNAAEKTREHLDKIITLRQIDMTINSNADLPLILDFILDQVISTFKIDAAMILIFNPFSMMLEGKNHRGLIHKEYHAYQTRIGDGIAGKTAMNRETLVIPDINDYHDGSLSETPLQKENFIGYFSTPLVSQGHILGVLEMYHRSMKVMDEGSVNFFESIGEQTAIAIDKIQKNIRLSQTNLKLELAFDQILDTFPKLLVKRKVDIPGHSDRVTSLTITIAELLGYQNEDLEYIRFGAILHDIGLLTIPDSILLKPGPLEPAEWEQIKQHPNTAFTILSKNLSLEKSLDIPRYHHEKWDGSGYPMGLTGEAIPESARIFAVADVWDILRSDRPYRKKWSDKKALDYIVSQSGKHFDPQAVSAFLDIQSMNSD